jgi:hypothetical protein
MPFGLKNAGATYQRCMLKYFGDLIRETVETYLDDIIVKSKKAYQLMADLKKTLRNSEKTASNSTLKSAFLGSLGVCCSGSSSLRTASKPT